MKEKIFVGVFVVAAIIFVLFKMWQGQIRGQAKVQTERILTEINAV